MTFLSPSTEPTGEGSRAAGNAQTLESRRGSSPTLCVILGRCFLFFFFQSSMSLNGLFLISTTWYREHSEGRSELIFKKLLIPSLLVREGENS